MKIKFFTGSIESIAKSGIGKAMKHQQKALDLVGVPYTLDADDEDYDILHINTIFPDNIPQIMKAKKLGKHVVVHAHSTEEDFKDSFMFSNYVSTFYKQWLRYLYKCGDILLTPTPYSKSLLETYNLDRKIYDISNGIDLHQFNPTQERIDAFCEKYDIKENDKVIISVGWFFERKGFDTFCEVAQLLPDYKFFWFGDPKLSNPPHSIKKLLDNPPANVYLPGYVNVDVLNGAYGRCNVFFFPSREETEGIVVLEALSCKCNVVLRDIPVFDPWLVDQKHCYKGKTNDDFSRIIQGIINGELPELGTAGYEVAKERNLKAIGEKLKGIYEEVMKMDPVKEIEEDSFFPLI